MIFSHFPQKLNVVEQMSLFATISETYFSVPSATLTGLTFYKTGVICNYLDSEGKKKQKKQLQLSYQQVQDLIDRINSPEQRDVLTGILNKVVGGMTNDNV